MLAREERKQALGDGVKTQRAVVGEGQGVGRGGTGEQSAGAGGRAEQEDASRGGCPRRNGPSIHKRVWVADVCQP